MLDNGFAPDFPEETLREVEALAAGAPALTGLERDLRELFWSSIDNRESRDLDQIEVAEELGDGSVRILVGVADVDAFVQKGSALDAHALENSASVYTGAAVFPMLPDRLSTDLTSLNQGEDRPAVMIEFVVAPDGEIISSRINEFKRLNRFDRLPLERPIRARENYLRLLRSGIFAALLAR
jgi:exoribonuclease-2